MRDVYEMLREKEIAIERVRREIGALRLACHLLCDESDLTSGAFESGVERKEKPDVLRLANEREDALAAIYARLVDTRPKSVKKGGGSGVLLQFRQVALGDSFVEFLTLPAYEYLA